MLQHMRANLWLLLLTVLLACVLYPAILLAVGQTVFKDKANGSLILDGGGKPVGSRLIAQPFGADEFFQPRPSAASYNGAASGASNWGASNYLLRDRVARQLGPIVKYHSGPKRGELVAPDVEKWFVGKPDRVADWAGLHPGVAAAWVNADDKHKAAVTSWTEKLPEAIAEWKKANPDGGDPKPADLAKEFFTDYAKAFPATWPQLIDDSTWSVTGVFFDMWLQEHPHVDLDHVPADRVMASGSGLDPHITMSNAHYQLDRVAAAWAKKTRIDEGAVRGKIKQLLSEKKEFPLGGLAGGVPLINVLEVNLALVELFKTSGAASK